MKRSIAETLFCCPLCKGSFISETDGVFVCGLCDETFRKDGLVYDFRVGAEGGARDGAKYEGLITQNQQLKWFEKVLNHLSAEEYGRLAADPHLDQIAAHIRALKAQGITIGERYDTIMLRENSIRDLHEIFGALRHFPQIKSRAVAVDLGCGTLRATKQLLRMGFERVIAVDLLPEQMLYGFEKLSREDRTKVVLVRADARYLPLADCSSDLVFSLGFFEHIDAPELMVLDVERILGGNGTAVINTWNGLGVRNQSAISERGRAYYENGFYYRFYDVAELSGILEKVLPNFTLRPYGCYLTRRLMHMAGEQYGKALLWPSAVCDRALSVVLPQSLFAFLVMVFQKEPAS